ncbi:MAG: ArsR family transcriptional regulator [Thaumarchaeota archaeon]|nr:ArsR family transcriptional regulator [Nitrososphaerota archaeon]
MNLLLRKPRTAKELASILSIQTSAARKHLEALREFGIGSYEYVRLGVGRPKKVFALTEKGRTLFPMRYAELLNMLLGNMINRSRGEVNQAIAQIAEAVGKEMNPTGKTDREQLANLSAALNEFGFVTSIEEDDRSYSIISRSCPLYQTASKYQPLICHGLHDGIIRSALPREDVKLKECMVLGQSLCRHVIVKRGRQDDALVVRSERS